MTGRATLAAVGTVLAMLAGPATASPLTFARGVRIVTPPTNGLAPRILPGTQVDYEINVTNQLDLFVSGARGVTIEETVSAKTRMQVTSLGTNGSPVQFEDGSLLGTGLLGSGATFGFVSLASETDGLEFTNGTAWGYIPRPDADGYDPAVRGFRVKLGGTHIAGRTFRLRYRVLIP
ncbi:hypothetical protein ACFSGX_09290 [Sphingomonas arantia]|uniref:DUF4402 domain-containing protein n=1 Tax=Sphingomonas arantia TaxID=1460676 RepID=A0ABW4TXZ0_9SPHN